MGFSGNQGFVQVLGLHCPVMTKQGGGYYDWATPGGTTVRWTDEVTRFELDETIATREYGHDKSGGGMDICAGNWSATLTINAVCHHQGVNVQGIGIGQVCYFELYVFGSCEPPLKGYAMLTRRPMIIDQEQGRPVEYTATFKSKFLWKGLPGSAAQRGGIGGFECECGSVGGGGSKTSIGSKDTEE